MDHIDGLIKVVIVGTIIAIVVSLIMNHGEKSDFMAGCVKDHKPYECQVMWAQSHPPAQEVYVHRY